MSDTDAAVRLGDFLNAQFCSFAEYRVQEVVVGADHNHQGVEGTITVGLSKIPRPEAWLKKVKAAGGAHDPERYPDHIHVSIPLDAVMAAIGRRLG